MHFLKYKTKVYVERAEALVYWLWETTHVQSVVGSNPSNVYWMDMTFFTFICCKNSIVCLKRPKIIEKRPGLAQVRTSTTTSTTTGLTLTRENSFPKMLFRKSGDRGSGVQMGSCDVSSLNPGLEHLA